jgi:hypothetical protein
VDPRAGLDDVEKRKFLILRGLEFPPFGLPTRIYLLFRLPYAGSYYYCGERINKGWYRLRKNYLYAISFRNESLMILMLGWCGYRASRDMGAI